MRRFLIWSGLAVVIGLVVAVSGYLAYDHFYARLQPVTITRNQGEIQRLLDEASWVSPGGGDRVAYIIGYRDSAATRAYERQEAERFRAAGVDVRLITFARPDRGGEARSTPNERATIAELWLNRDWDLYRRWTAQPAATWQAEGLAPADRNLARTAVVEASRRFIAELNGLMRDAGVQPTWPLVIWRDGQGFLKACACADSRSWDAVRQDLGAVETAPPPLPISPEPHGAPTPETPSVEGLPYPDPIIAPPIRPQPAPPASQPQTRGQPPSQSRPGYTPPRTGPPLTGPSRAVQPAPTARPARPATRPRVEPDTMFY